MTEEDLEHLTPVARMDEEHRFHVVQENGVTEEVFQEAGKTLEELTAHQNTALRKLEVHFFHWES